MLAIIGSHLPTGLRTFLLTLTVVDEGVLVRSCDRAYRRLEEAGSRWFRGLLFLRRHRPHVVPVALSRHRTRE